MSKAMSKANKGTEGRRGFAVLIQPFAGFTLHQVRDLERRIEDYGQAHDLEMAGHHLAFAVSSPERSLTATDQVDFVDWLSGQPGICTVRLTPLHEQPEASSAQDGAFLLVAALDSVTMGLKLLYRSRRINAELYLQILGGFVRPASLH
jgi:hypothetical protein